MTDQKRVINIALQGGGAHGAFTWGVLDRLLDEERVAFEGLSGTSAGAVNAALLAYGLHIGGAQGAKDKLEEFWYQASLVGSIFSPVRSNAFDTFWANTFGGAGPMVAATYNAFDAATRTISPYQFNLFDFNPLKDILKKCINFDTLRCCQAAKIFINATNVKTGKIRVFDTSEITLDTILASACLPYLYKAVEIRGEAYWDGGFIGNPALFPFFYKCKQSRDILIVHINPMIRDEVPKTAPDIMNRINEISFNSSLISELRAIKFANKLVQKEWLKDEHKHEVRDMLVHSIRSDDALIDLSVASKFDVSWDFLTKLRDLGRQSADDWLNTHFDALGKQSSVDLEAEFFNLSNIAGD